MFAETSGGGVGLRGDVGGAQLPAGRLPEATWASRVSCARVKSAQRCAAVSGVWAVATWAPVQVSQTVQAAEQGAESAVVG